MLEGKSQMTRLSSMKGKSCWVLDASLSQVTFASLMSCLTEDAAEITAVKNAQGEEIWGGPRMGPCEHSSTGHLSKGWAVDQR